MKKTNFAKLNVENVASKDFEIEFRGYKVEEVDQFLDLIVGDYAFYETELANKEQEVMAWQQKYNQLQEEFNLQEQRLRDAQERLDKLSKKGVQSYELVERLSALEKKTSK